MHPMYVSWLSWYGIYSPVLEPLIFPCIVFSRHASSDTIVSASCAGHYGAKFAAPQLRFLLPEEIAPAIQQQSEVFILG